MSSIIQWAPPMTNWNPWIGSNIDEGPLAYATMDSISEDLFRAEQYQCQNRSPHQQLPVVHYREKILQEIKANNVILIRGATGCGKTTQVHFSSFSSSI